MEELAPILGPIGILAVIGWVIQSFFAGRKQIKMAQVQAGMHEQLLNRFESAEELRAYLEGDAGRRFVEAATAERKSPYGRILGSIQVGLILTFAGIALLLLQNTFPEGAEGFALLGALALATGLGFLLSSLAAYKLSKEWGLLNGGSSTK